MNTENSTDLQNYYLNGLNKITNEIVEKSADGDYIYRGEPKCYPKIASKLYRNRYAEPNQRSISIKVDQAVEIASAANYLRSGAEADFFAIGSELRHYVKWTPCRGQNTLKISKILESFYVLL